MGSVGAQFTLIEGNFSCDSSTSSTTMVRVGGNCSMSISVDYLQGEFDEPIVLSVENLPPGVTAEPTYVDPTGLVPNTGAVLHLYIRGVAEAGPVELIVKGTTAAHGSATFTVPLTITSRPGFPLASVAVGDDVACGIDASGQAFCWGDNTQGQLGIGTSGLSSGDYTRLEPTAVLGGVSFSKIASAGGMTCGLDVNGAAYCWGKGWLGDGDVTSEPRTAPGPVDGDLSFVELVVGGALVCGLTDSGEIYCWGGANGGLGDGTYNGAYVPTNIASGRSYVAIAASNSATCGLADDGSVYCWGDNTWGQRGAVTPDDLLSPTAVVTSLTFKAIAMADDATCGLTDEGTAYCWGSNSSGNLGLGASDRDPHLSPVAVSGGLVFSTLEGGDGFCGLDPNGKAYCWGFAGSEAEDGEAVSAPTPVSGELVFSQISVGTGMNCGIATNGLTATYCWIHGSGNYNGYLGTGDTEDYTGPVPIAEP